MARVKLKQGQVAIIFNQNGDYNRVIRTDQRIGFFENATIFDLKKPLFVDNQLDYMLEDQKFRSMIHLVEVAESEIVLRFENRVFKDILKPGRYTYWKSVINYEFVRFDTQSFEQISGISRDLMSKVQIASLIRIFQVESYETALIIIDGALKGKAEKGSYYYWKNATPITFLKADLRSQYMEVSGQEMLTRDKAALRINFDVQFKIVDIHKALMENKDYSRQLYLSVQLALREFIGLYTLDELLERKDSISEYIAEALEQRSKELGIQILNSGIRDIILPGDVKAIMNEVLIAQKQAQANVITRREETASTRSLLNTAKLMEENAMLFKLKEMEYVEKIADKINTISVSGGGKVVDQLKEIFSGNA